MSPALRGGARRTARHWERLGSEDPLWAVYVAPGTRGGRWDRERFEATGRAEVTRVLRRLDELGLPASAGLAVDFGCGVGRLSRPLAARFSRVVGVDVSDAMLAQAKEMSAHDERIEYVLNRADDLGFLADRTVDLLYSSLVLQHLPRRLAAAYLAEFVRVIKADGVAVVQVATKPIVRSVKGWAFRAFPASLTGLLQRRFLRYPAPMRMQAMSERWVRRHVAHAGGRVVAAERDASYGGHWVYNRYAIVPH
jgi:ubiquinone/menaquinone biosynthesis C-methylase UbiE